MIEKKTGKKFVIDTVKKSYNFGWYLMICFREEGSKIHGVAYIENISSEDPLVISGVKKTLEKFKII